MTIAFDAIVPGNRVPGSQAEFSNVRAVNGLPVAAQKILLVGQRLATGTVPALQTRRIASGDQAANYFGRGSTLHGMAVASIAAGTAIDLWAIALDDNAAGVAGTTTITLTGPAGGAGTLAYLIAGQAVSVGVAVGDTITAMATAVAAAVNAALDLPVTASSALGVVTLTSRHKGTNGNEFEARQNHYDGQALPAGVTSTIAVGVVGATNPDVTAVFAAIGDEQFQAIALGFRDVATLNAVDTELNSRWGPARQNEGRAYIAMSGTFSTLTAYGVARNGIHTTLIGVNQMPSPAWKIAAAVATIAAASLQADPARPMTNLVVPGLIAARIESRYSRVERNALLGSGVSTLKVLAGGDVAIERLVTCYQVNAFGFPDPSYLDVQTTATLGYFRSSWRQRMAAKFPRAKLTIDTIAGVRAETIALARDWGDAELMEDVDGFIAGLRIERDPTNATQLNLLLTPDTVNGLLQLAARFEFIL